MTLWVQALPAHGNNLLAGHVRTHPLSSMITCNTLCMYVLAAPMWDQRSQVTHKVMSTPQTPTLTPHPPSSLFVCHRVTHCACHHGRALQPRVHDVHDQAGCSVCASAHAAASLHWNTRCCFMMMPMTTRLSFLFRPQTVALAALSSFGVSFPLSPIRCLRRPPPPPGPHHIVCYRIQRSTLITATLSVRHLP